MNKSFEQDWSFLKNGIEDLKEYLLSAQLYWPLPVAHKQSASAVVSSLTPGNLLLVLRRLQAADLSDAERKEFERYASEFQTTRSRWTANWSKKASQEFTARLGMWQNTLSELNENPSRHAAEYASSARVRTILELLLPEREGVDGGAAEALVSLDQRLRRITKPAGFIWEPEIKDAFPEDRFWFLYVSVK